MNSDVIIQVEGLSKQYRLGEVSTGSLHHDINRWWHRVRGLPDPYLSVTGVNIRTGKLEKTADRRPQTADRGEKTEDGRQKTEDFPEGGAGLAPSGGSKGLQSAVCSLQSDYVWALQDINFEVRRGEVLGIIGRNGAGKSTLLKIMSRITAPTTGEVRIKGRIASLLEVGTGFHQDLTGRENIFLNGAVLGMTKTEIAAKLDEIVEFSGCATYLDTPVKRYSSGMVVRLGFAVAAHLEPEILIVDEVLAVGDLEFQKKCIGKMQDVASQGRTVLFVSHNLAAVQNLCQTAIWLDHGTVAHEKDAAEKVVSAYEQSGQSASGTISFLPSQHRVQSGFQVNAVTMLDQTEQPTATFKYGEPVCLRLRVYSKEAIADVRLGIAVRASGLVFTTLLSPVLAFLHGENVAIDCTLPRGVLLPGTFDISIGASKANTSVGLDYIADAAVFSVSDVSVDQNWVRDRRQAGIVQLPTEWRKA